MAKTMPAGAFKAPCLKVMDEVQADRREVVITKRGVPVAKIVAVDAAVPDIFDCMAGTAHLRGDVVRPLIPAKQWTALR